MTAPRFHLSGFPRAIGLAVLQNLVAALWLAASPALHAAAHKDASELERACAVTLFEAGNFHAPTTHANSRAQTGCACARGTFLSALRIRGDELRAHRRRAADLLSHLIVPAVCAVLLARTIRIRMLIGCVIALVGGVGGMIGSFYADLPSGAAIVCALGVLLVTTASIAPLIRRKTPRPATN